MRRLLGLLAAALFCVASPALGQQLSGAPGVSQAGAVTANNCTAWAAPGVIKDAGSACGSGSGSAPGGTNGQTQYNNAGSLGGYTPTGDLSVTPSTGVTIVTKTNGVAFAASATTDTTVASNISSGTLPAARLPNPTASTLGGVESLAATTHQWINTISTSGVPASTQPACADISDAAASCATNALNASNISSGTLAAARGGAGTITGALKGSGAGVVTQAACADLSNGAASCATDTTNASNISSGTLAAARGGAGTVNGLLKANGSGVVALAVSGTDYAPSSATVGSVSAGNGLASTAGTCNSGAITTTGTLSACNDVLTKTGNYTLVNGDGFKTINCNAAGGCTFTVPQATASGNFAEGWNACFTSQQGAVTLTPVTSTFYPTQVATTLQVGQTACVASDGTNYLITGPTLTATVGGILTLQSGIVDTTRVVTAAGVVSVGVADIHVCVNKTTGAATTANLPSSPTTGQRYSVDDCKGDALTNNITVTPAAGNIDGASTFVINTNFGSWSGYYTGTIWKTTSAR